MTQKNRLNVQSATTPEQCEVMEKMNGWKLKGVEPSGDSILAVNCIFEGEQFNFAKADPYSDLYFGDEDE
jgi:hypothetical protein